MKGFPPGPVEAFGGLFKSSLLNRGAQHGAFGHCDGSVDIFPGCHLVFLERGRRQVGLCPTEFLIRAFIDLMDF